MITDAGHSIAFLHFVTLTFDLILIGGRGLVMYYPFAKFDYFSFIRFRFYHTKRQTESQTPLNALDKNHRRR